ncbi:MAG: hypothetical protein N4A50_06215 [Vallitalea sp.]|jgi:hypothetical protein|nr:hypothetical protein [Vallitalea sp.]
MNEFQITIKENDLTNLLVFLDRVEYKGLKEVEAVSVLTYALKNATRIEKTQEEFREEEN